MTPNDHDLPTGFGHFTGAFECAAATEMPTAALASNAAPSSTPAVSVFLRLILFTVLPLVALFCTGKPHALATPPACAAGPSWSLVGHAADQVGRDW
jgi:hypothetical protein